MCKLSCCVITAVPSGCAYPDGERPCTTNLLSPLQQLRDREACTTEAFHAISRTALTAHQQQLSHD